MRHHTAGMLTVLLLFAPVALNAQAPASETVSERDIPRAEALEIDAQRWMMNFVDAKKAAGLLRQAASLRPAEDPTGIQDLITAGHLYYYVRDFDRSRDAMADAGDRAWRAGDLMQAANSWINAAHLSVRLNDAEGARSFSERARLVSTSPLLSAVQVSHIQARLDPNPPVVAAGSR